MKMVKSLLLGSAAGLVAVAGAQAADLPVKAAPVQYVKICSLYGVGFYYIPGTDMCIKIGGWVRAEAAWHTNNSSIGTFINDQNNRGTGNTWYRIRGYITADARNQTEYGTVRGYLAVGLSTNTNGGDNAANQFDANRAFIQWAGFTFGRAQSFFDFFSQAALGYLGFNFNSDTGDGGKEVFAYTAQFGNGFSGSISAEARRNTQIINIGAPNAPFAVVGGVLTPVAGVVPACGTVSGGSFTASGNTVNSFGCYGGWQVPDIVANLRVDQAWGSAQIMGALHEVNATYYAQGLSAAAISGGTVLTPGVEQNGHPSDAWGWAAGAGLRINTPWLLNWFGSGQGDYFSTMVTYTQGALRYLFQNPGTGNMYLQNNQETMFGIMSDGVYGGVISNGTATSVELTTAWGINAGYEHFWTPQWRTSLYGGYAEVKYDGQANALLCSTFGAGTGQGINAVANSGCDMNWKQWYVGSRTQWNVTKDFYMGLDVAYVKFDTAQMPGGVTGGTNIAGAPVTNGNTLLFPAGTNTFSRLISSEDNWQVRFRVHRDFYP